MADNVDLESPLADFLARTGQLRTIMSLVEATSRNPTGVTFSQRRTVDVSLLGGATSNTTNAMCIVFLAASFEEFFREIVAQCGVQLSESYSTVPDEIKLTAKGSYWKACLEQLRFTSRILSKGTPKTLDSAAVAKAKSIVDSARGFVMMDDGTAIDGKIFYQHGRNFRPDVVDEIASRIGIKKVLRKASDSTRLKSYFGVSTVAEVEPVLIAKLNDFYRTRNEIVHSLNASTGFGIDYVFDHIELVEAFAESLRSVFKKHIASWIRAAA